MNPESNSSTRREFLQGSSAVAAGVALGSALSFPNVVRAANVKTDKLKLGLIGCGGRGSGAAKQALSADHNVQLVAMADVFENQLKNALGTLNNDKEVGEKVKVENTKTFVGLDSYQKLLDSGVDLVILATPPGFRPQHLWSIPDTRRRAVAGELGPIVPSGSRVGLSR